eukprot:6410696-Pyramimonas_sp.AAC.1
MSFFNSSPPKLADNELDKWKAIWQLHKEDQLPPPQDAKEWEQLPPINGAQTRKVILSFAKRTGTGQ